MLISLLSPLFFHISIVPHLLLCPLFFPDIPRMRENTQYLSLWEWLISLDVMIPGPIYFPANGITSFFLVFEEVCCVWTPQFLIRLFDEHLGGLHTSAFVNSAAVNMRMQVALLCADFGEHAHKSGKAELCGPLYV